MELFCPGDNKEVSRNTHKAQQVKNLVKLEGHIAKNTTKKTISKEISKKNDPVAALTKSHFSTTALPHARWQNLKGY